MSQILVYPVPTKGLNTNQEPTAFSDAFSPFLKNVYVDLTKCRKRRGISQIGSSSLPLSGVGMKMITYVDARGNRHEIALTTTRAYLYDGTNDEWDDITPSEVLSSADSGWTTAGDVIVSHDTVVKKEGTASVKMVMDAEHTDGEKLMYEDFSAIDITDRNAIGFWFRSSDELPSGAVEIVVSENANGSKTNGVTVAIDKASGKGVWHYFIIPVDLSAMNAVISIGIYANATLASGLEIHIDDVKAHVIFAGGASNLWSYSLATDTNEFGNNGGMALVISNGVDDLQYFEGQSDDKFQLLVHASGASHTDVVAEFWNHFMLLNFNDGDQNVKSLLYSAAGNIDDHTSDNAGANTLTDTIGQILNALKLGSSLIIYSEDTITVGRYYGGLTIFTFPTLVFGTGVVAANAVLSIANVHLILGNDQKVYAYYGDTDMVPIGEAIEDGLFAALDVSKKVHIVSGLDAGKYKVHFFIPGSGESDYASMSYCFNYRQSHLSWEFHDFSKTVKGFGSVLAAFDWYCDEDPMKDVFCDETALYCDDSSGQLGYELPAFISDDGYVYKLDEASDGKDDDVDIAFELWTPEFIVSAEEQIGRWVWFSFQGYSGVINSTVTVQYSTDRGDSWTEITDSPVSLNQRWTTHRLPIDVVNRRIIFRFLQTSNKDVQLRGLFKCAVEPQSERD